MAEMGKASRLRSRRSRHVHFGLTSGDGVDGRWPERRWDTCISRRRHSRDRPAGRSKRVLGSLARSKERPPRRGEVVVKVHFLAAIRRRPIRKSIRGCSTNRRVQRKIRWSVRKPAGGALGTRRLREEIEVPGSICEPIGGAMHAMISCVGGVRCGRTGTWCVRCAPFGYGNHGHLWRTGGDHPCSHTLAGA